jgi:hypothetical protein
MVNLIKIRDTANREIEQNRGNLSVTIHTRYTLCVINLYFQQMHHSRVKAQNIRGFFDKGSMKEPQSRTVHEPALPELFIGLVGAVGTDLEDLVLNALIDALGDVEYEAHDIHLSDQLHSISSRLYHNEQKHLSALPKNERIKLLMNLGDEFRKRTGERSAVCCVWN